VFLFQFAIMHICVYVDMFTFQILIPTLENAPEIGDVAFSHSLQIDLCFSICSLVLLYMLDEVYASLIGCWHS